MAAYTAAVSDRDDVSKATVVPRTRRHRKFVSRDPDRNRMSLRAEPEATEQRRRGLSRERDVTGDHDVIGRQ